MTTPVQYLNNCRVRLITNSIIQKYEIVDAYADERKGYLRIRASLKNGDFLELAEYFVAENDLIFTQDYRFQWMNTDKTKLKYRWDNTPHFSDLPDAPHHIHVGDDVKPYQAMNFETALERIEELLDAQN